MRRPSFDPPDGWRLMSREVFSCPSCRTSHPARPGDPCAPVYGAFGAMVRVCPSCEARVWSCPACGNGPCVERDDETRACPCGFVGHIPRADKPASWREPRPVELVHIAPVAVAVEPEPPARVEPAAPAQAPAAKRAPVQRKPRTQKAPEGQGSLF